MQRQATIDFQMKCPNIVRRGRAVQLIEHTHYKCVSCIHTWVRILQRSKTLNNPKTVIGLIFTVPCDCLVQWPRKNRLNNCNHPTWCQKRTRLEEKSSTIQLIRITLSLGQNLIDRTRFNSWARSI